MCAWSREGRGAGAQHAAGGACRVVAAAARWQSAPSIAAPRRDPASDRVGCVLVVADNYPFPRRFPPSF